MNEPALIHRQRELLRELARLAAERARIEPALSQTQREQLSAIEAEHEAAAKAAKDGYAADKTAMDGELRQTSEAAEARALQDQQAEDQDYQTKCDAIAARFEADKQAGQDALKLAGDMLGAELEGDKADAEKKKRDSIGEVTAQRQKLKEFRQKVLEQLTKWEQPASFLDLPAPEPNLPAPEVQPPELYLTRAEKGLKRMRNLTAPRYVATKRLALIFGPLALALTYPLGRATTWLADLEETTGAIVGWGLLVAAIVCGIAAVVTKILLARKARVQLHDLCQAMAENFAEGDDRYKKLLESFEVRSKREVHEANKRHIDKMTAARNKAAEQWKALKDRRERAQAPVDAAHRKRTEEIDARRSAAIRAAEKKHASRWSDLHFRQESALAEARSRRERRTNEIVSSTEGGWQSLAANWKRGLNAVLSGAAEVRHESDQIFLPWTDPAWERWTPPATNPDVMRLGDFDVQEGQHAADDPKALPPAEFALPALRAFPDDCSLLFKAELEGRDRAVEALRGTMFRLLTAVAPGKIRFTIIDPAGLGQNFAAFMNLADYNDQVINSRIWTEAGHIDQRLSDLTAHIENVVQTYLRDRFANIVEYNAQAGEVAEPFRVVVVANFPVNFNDEAARRLVSIARNGPRSGVYTLISVDTRQPMPHGFDLADLEASALVFEWQGGKFIWRDPELGRFPLRLEGPPQGEQANRILAKAGAAAAAAARVEVPFEFVTPARDGDWWQSDSRRGLNVPLGRSGAMKRQSLELGRGTSQHVIVAGKTGSGKSTLLHCLVTNAALFYSPDEVELYLIDFKKGVEFKAYATHALPHARVVAIESEREFGMSVLQRLDAELTRRGEMFRSAGAQNIGDYRDVTGRVLPRLLLIVDEFQEFFIEDDRVARDAAQLFDRLVRQGRAFGMHVILGSQSIGGAYSLARSTIDQMAVRIALQCSETDANLILSQDNSAARLLTRPGEAIYNDANGLVEGNTVFQVVWLADEQREGYLKKVRARAGDRPGPIVFEGNLPADVSRNQQLSDWIGGTQAATVPAHAVGTTAFVGEAMALTGQTGVPFRRQNGCNLVVVGQNEESAHGILATALVSLAFQTAPAGADGAPRFVVFDALQPDPKAGALGAVAAALGRPVRLAGNRQLADVFNELSAELEQRQKATDGDFPAMFVVLYGIHRARDLRRPEDEYSFMSKGDSAPTPSAQFATLLREGPPLGIHFLIWSDTLANLQRTIDRQAMREIVLRIVLQMNATDSSNLIDTPVAGKLGSNRGLYFNEEEGKLEKFRPYAPPAAEWLAQVKDRLGASRMVGDAAVNGPAATKEPGLAARES